MKIFIAVVFAGLVSFGAGCGSDDGGSSGGGNGSNSGSNGTCFSYAGRDISTGESSGWACFENRRSCQLARADYLEERRLDGDRSISVRSCGSGNSGSNDNSQFCVSYAARYISTGESFSGGGCYENRGQCQFASAILELSGAILELSNALPESSSEVFPSEEITLTSVGSCS